MTDPIADMLTRIRNGLTAGKTKVSIPFSNFKLEIANFLKDEGWIEDTAVVEEPSKSNSSSAMFKKIQVTLKYNEYDQPVIRELERVSKPGRRIYRGAGDVDTVKSGYGMAVISSSDGVMSAEQAENKNKGGEVIFKIW